MHTWGILRYRKFAGVLLGIVFLGAFSWFQYASAAQIVSYSDRISNSAPSVSSNHTVNFTTKVAIPPGGYVKFIPDPDDFTISNTDFDIDNVALYERVSTSYILRTATTTPTATEDGVTITTGTTGQIEITLNSTEGIPANTEMRLLIGSNTPYATTTDVGIMNPSGIGSYRYTIAIGGGAQNSSVSGVVAIVDAVKVGDIDTHEFDPPERFNGAPTGNLSGLTYLVQMSLNTNEFSRCRYSVASNTPYFSMGSEFTTYYSTIHSTYVAVSSSTSYTFFVRCIDDEGNINIDDYSISFAVLPPPTGTPGPSGSVEGTGSGTGEGSGDSNPGTGSPNGSDNTSGGSSGGGGGGGGGGGSGVSSGGSAGSGGFEGIGKPYQSGDGRVIINGFAFPRSDIVILVDGKIADQIQSAGDGAFSVTLDAIASGAYTFGAYGIDKNGIKSSTFSTTFTVTGARGSTLSNINVLPSIKVSPDPVQPDSTVKMSGYAIPNATITIENQSDKSSANLKTFMALSDGNGLWSVDIPTTGFTKGTYKVRAKAKQETGASTNFSNYTMYGVGEAANVPRTSDLNKDGKVNLTDFSILLFWWNTDGGKSSPPADINQDGKVSLTDFSILIFNWTG
jgi:hypothetical protein